MKNKQTLFTILSHLRHDYLNELQLIKGNLQLENYERCEHLVDNFANKLTNESRLVNLKLNNFALMLINFNNNFDRLELSYQVHNINSDLTVMDFEVSSWFEDFLLLLQESSHLGSANKINLEIYSKDHQLFIEIKFSSDKIASQKINNFLKIRNPNQSIQVEEINDKMLFMTVIFG